MKIAMFYNYTAVFKGIVVVVGYFAALGVVITAYFLWHNRSRMTLIIRDPIQPDLEIQRHD